MVNNYNNGNIKYTHVSIKFFEGMKHVETVKVDYSSCTSVIAPGCTVKEQLLFFEGFTSFMK